MGDYSGNIKMTNVKLIKQSTVYMIFYSLLFIHRKLCRAEAFSEILTYLAKQKLEINKLNNLKKSF